MPVTYTKEDLPVNDKGVSISEKIKRWKYLEEIAGEKLLSGSGLTNQIVRILVKFREDYVAIMGDIEAMFYQVFVASQHRSLLSFFWW